MADNLILPTRQNVVDLCENNTEVTNHLVCALAEGSSTLFVKCDPDSTGDAPRFFVKYCMRNLGQARTQEYLFNQAVLDMNAPCLPKVYDAFDVNHGMYTESYIVMEFIDAPTVETWLKMCPTDTELIYDLVAEAVGWLMKLPPPANAALGPIGGGCAQHKVFPDDSAPLAFTSKDALQRFFNEVQFIYLSNLSLV